MVLANLVFLVVYAATPASSTAFLDWAWRIPFVLSAGLIVTALLVRWRVKETPAFAEAPATAHSEVAIKAMLREQRRQFLLAAGAVIGVSPWCQVGTFFTHYATAHLGYSTDLVLLVGAVGGLCTAGFVAASATLSDVYGRRAPLTVGYALAVPWSLAVFWLIETRNDLLFGAAIVLTYTIIGIVLGPMTSFIPETFAMRYRYTGAALAHNIGGILGGGVPPVISEYLLRAYGSSAIGLMLGGLSLVSLVCVRMLDETAPVQAPRVHRHRITAEPEVHREHQRYWMSKRLETCWPNS